MGYRNPCTALVGLGWGFGGSLRLFEWAVGGLEVASGGLLVALGWYIRQQVVPIKTQLQPVTKPDVAITVA